jgi:hypothetical protein
MYCRDALSRGLEVSSGNYVEYSNLLSCYWLVIPTFSTMFWDMAIALFIFRLHCPIFRRFLTVFFVKQLLLVPIDGYRKDFEFCLKFVELLMPQIVSFVITTGEELLRISKMTPPVLKTRLPGDRWLPWG